MIRIRDGIKTYIYCKPTQRYLCRYLDTMNFLRTYNLCHCFLYQILSQESSQEIFTSRIALHTGL